ncbi:MAG TPA: nitrilase-related carbon-nitrogen hydrolase [Ktedonobacterales bacterium]|jgi:predicted amidohydrolase|nr:nitrilase-related carbon-nitrogen hydrolase [Ktedonobacterales bacterium]
MTGSGRLVRAVAVGNRIVLPATEAVYVAELERIVGLAVPHLAADRPNLLVLGEVLGLPAAFAGRGGSIARRAHRTQNALIFLALAQLPRILRCHRLWPGTSLARALLLANTDILYRPFAETLARLAATYRTHIVATTLAPRVSHSTDPSEITRWGRRGAYAVYVPEGPEVYNAALVFGPDGTLLARIDKVFLTEDERKLLDLMPGSLDDVHAVVTAAGRLGVAISLDAFTPGYLQRLDAEGAEIVVQPDANGQIWAARSKTWPWQPEEWLNSVLGSIQPVYRNLRYNICAMQTGNLVDLPFDGQSSITARDAAAPQPGQAFVGVDAPISTLTGNLLAGGFLAVSPWAMDDPIIIDSTLTLEQRRARLAAVGRELLPGGKRANEYRESVIWADLEVG